MYHSVHYSLYKVPQEKEIYRRLKGFYCSRRSVLLTNEDPEKKKKRKIALKASRQTYVSHVS